MDDISGRRTSVSMEGCWTRDFFFSEDRGMATLPMVPFDTQSYLKFQHFHIVCLNLVNYTTKRVLNKQFA